MCELCGINLFSIEKVLGSSTNMPPNSTKDCTSESDMNNSNQQHTAPFSAPTNRVKRLKSSKGMFYLIHLEYFLNVNRCR